MDSSRSSFYVFLQKLLFRIPLGVPSGHSFRNSFKSSFWGFFLWVLSEDCLWISSGMPYGNSSRDSLWEFRWRFSLRIQPVIASRDYFWGYHWKFHLKVSLGIHNKSRSGVPSGDTFRISLWGFLQDLTIVILEVLLGDFSKNSFWWFLQLFLLGSPRDSANDSF